jgi:DNA repair exonuclease SbcCD ATPase subunit
MQSELAAKLATAPPEARTILLASIREIDAQLEGLTNESAAVARLLADYEEQLVKVEVAASKAKRDLAQAEATLESFDEATVAGESTRGARDRILQCAVELRLHEFDADTVQLRHAPVPARELLPHHGIR